MGTLAWLQTAFGILMAFGLFGCIYALAQAFDEIERLRCRLDVLEEKDRIRGYPASYPPRGRSSRIMTASDDEQSRQ